MDRWLSKLWILARFRPGEKHGLADTNLTSRRVIKGDDGADGHEPKEATTRGRRRGWFVVGERALLEKAWRGWK